MQRLEGKIAIVVGAGSIGPGWGNGKATAVTFARHGAKVFCVDRNGDAAAETVRLIEAEGGVAMAHTADVSRNDEVAAMVAACVKAVKAGVKKLADVGTPKGISDDAREGYELFRELWRSDSVTWSGQFRPSLDAAKALPRPLQPEIRIWHGSATSTSSVEVAAQHGDPVFSANVTYPIEPYADLIDHYRRVWAENGHDPADALVGAGTAGFFVAPTSQEALAAYEPIFAARRAFALRTGLPTPFTDLADFVDRSSALIGSPAQVIDKVGRYHERLGHEVTHLSADGDGLTARAHRLSLELFQSDVAPTLRSQIPARPIGSASLVGS